MTVPEPECELGYPLDQVEGILGDRMDDFGAFMRGQTGSICDGRRYDYGKGHYVETGCGPHGMVVYGGDVEKFLRWSGRRD